MFFFLSLVYLSFFLKYRQFGSMIEGMLWRQNITTETGIYKIQGWTIRLKLIRADALTIGTRKKITWNDIWETNIRFEYWFIIFSSINPKRTKLKILNKLLLFHEPITYYYNVTYNMHLQKCGIHIYLWNILFQLETVILRLILKLVLIFTYYECQYLNGWGWMLYLLVLIPGEVLKV